MRVLRTAATVAALTLLGGCATTAPPSTAGRAFTVDASYGLVARLHKADEAYFVRFVPQGTSLVAVELSTRRLTRASPGEEILGYLPRESVFVPAFDELPRTDNDHLAICGLLDERKPDVYAPCHSGTAFYGTSVVGSALSNALALPLTLGTGANKMIALNKDGIRKLVVEQRVLERIERLHEVNEASLAMGREIAAADRLLVAAAQVKITTHNRTGFPARDLTPGDLALRITRDAKPPRFTSARLDAGDPFAPMLATIAARRAELLTARTFEVACTPTLDAGLGSATFHGRVACDRSVAEQNGALNLRAAVTLESASFGVRLPQIAASSAALLVRFDADGLVIENRAGEYVEITSIAVYGGRRILDRAQNLSLAPLAETQVPADSLMDRELRQLLTFDRVTAASVAGKSVPFGVAVKYRVGRGGNFETLLKRQSYPIAPLLRP